MTKVFIDTELVTRAYQVNAIDGTDAIHRVEDGQGKKVGFNKYKQNSYATHVIEMDKKND